MDASVSSWDDLRVFLAVAESGSFSAAARALRVGQPTISRRIGELEERVGTTLFVRGKDGATLTAEAQALLPAARRMDEAATDWARTLDAGDVRPRGRVKVTAPPGIAWALLVPFARQLAAELPEIELSVHASVGFLDLRRGEADLAIRTRAPTGAELESLTSVTFGVSAMVSPTLLAQLPNPCALSDVPWIAWAEPYEELPPNPQLEELIPDFRPVFRADNYLVQLQAAQLGLGAMPLAPELGRLVGNLGLVPIPGLNLDAYRTEIFVIASKTAMRSARTRAVAARLVGLLEQLGAK